MEQNKPCLGCRQSPCNCYYEQCPDCLKFINHGNLADCCQCGGEDEEEENRCSECGCLYAWEAINGENYCTCNYYGVDDEYLEEETPTFHDPGEDWPPEDYFPYDGE